MSTKKFTPAKAAYTKAQIVSEVNELIAAETGKPITGKITNAEAQSYMDGIYTWLQDSVGRHEDDSDEAEIEFMTQWYDRVLARQTGNKS